MYKLGSKGDISIYSTAAVDLVVDLQGYGLASAEQNGSSYTAAAPPARLVDTRTPSGSCPASPCTALGAGGSATLQVIGGASPVPAGASAVVVNLTALPAGGSGSMAAYAGDQRTAPNASSLSFGAAPVANTAIVRPSPDGKVRLAVTSLTSGSVGYVVDIVGWYTTAWSYTYNTDGLRTAKVAPDPLTNVIDGLIAKNRLRALARSRESPRTGRTAGRPPPACSLFVALRRRPVTVAGVAGVVRGHQGPLAHPLHEVPALVGIQVVVVAAGALEVLQAG